MENASPLRRPRGRPRAFDRKAALAAAAQTFWRFGYEGASIADLTRVMGITPQSLYAAFGSKAQLYREALAWYQDEIGSATARALAEEATILGAMRRILLDAAREFCRPDQPRGCMVSTASLACAAENADVARHVAELRSTTLAALRARIERAILEGEMRPDTDAAALARYLGAIIQGMSIQARDGASEAELTGIAGIALSEVTRHLVSRGEPAA